MIRNETPGVAPAVRLVLEEAFETPLEAVMLLVLDPGVATRLAGLGRYRPEFDASV